MSSVNKVIIVGHCGRDPEIRAFPSGDQVANLTIATSEKWKDRQTGDMKESTEWHRVIFGGRLAEIAGQYLRKGSLVYVEGSLKTRKWTDKDGKDNYATEIRASSLQMLGPRPDGERAPAPTKDSGLKPSPKSSGFDDMDDDIPFISNAFAWDSSTSKQRRMSRYDY